MSYDDDFDDPKQAGISAWLAERKSRLAGIALLCVLLFFVGLIWASYQSGGHAPETLPLIAADTQPYKSAPDDPGGMDIANRDTTVFDALSPDNKDSDAKAAAEDLFVPDDAVPADRDAAYFSGLKTETTAAATGAVDKPVPEKTQEKEPAKKKEAAAPAAASAPSENELASVDEKPAASAPPEKPAKPEPAKEPAPPATPPAEPAPAKAPSTPLARDPSQLETAAGSVVAASGSTYIQLASLPNAADAPAAWKKLQGEFSSQLAGLSHRVVAVDLPGKGTFHRLQAGPLSADEAAKRCAAIKALRAGACLVAR